MNHGLPERTLKTLFSIFEKYAALERVVLYGSRAMGNYRAGSDIDLALFTGEGWKREDLLHLMADAYAYMRPNPICPTCGLLSHVASTGQFQRTHRARRTHALATAAMSHQPFGLLPRGNLVISYLSNSI
jgi:hypothetical protein